MIKILDEKANYSSVLKESLKIGQVYLTESFFFFFKFSFMPFQDYFSSYETGQSVGG